MNSALLLLLSVIMAPFLGPNVRIDHQNLPTHSCVQSAIAVGPGAPSSQPLYVAFEDDSLMGGVRSDVWFQKSTDAGRTWLPADLLIRRGERYASDPDITTDSDGNVYIVYVFTDSASNDQISCVRSSDGGTTWSAPARVDVNSVGRIGWARIAADSAGNLFAAWNQLPGGISRVFSSVSTDKGATWSPSVRVDDDTTNEGCYHADVFVQPGTNHYLVTASACRRASLYRSTDRGLTFEPGVQLDTFNAYAGQPHVVADRDHIICDYTGAGESLYGHQNFTESRTFYSGPDTWGGPVSVTELDTLHSLSYSGELALSADGRVHTALTMCRMGEWLHDVYYASSSDHGGSWSDRELVNDDTTGNTNTAYPDIGTDSAGHAYVVWSDGRNGRFRIWFATNNPAAIAEQPPQQPVGVQPSATVVRNVLFLPEATGHKLQTASSLLDIGGRRVMDLRPGPNDVRALAPGVYFVREAQTQAVRKVIISD